MTKKALFITSNVGVEHDELIQPLHFLQSKGIECIHAAIEASDVRTVKNDRYINQGGQFLNAVRGVFLHCR